MFNTKRISTCSSGFDENLIEDGQKLEDDIKLYQNEENERILIKKKEIIMLQTCKIAIFGAANVGKSQLVNYYIF